MTARLTDQLTMSDWHADAACQDADIELFFSTNERDQGQALAYCAVCPVRDACLQQALMHRETFGIWGGTTEAERRRILRASRRHAA